MKDIIEPPKKTASPRIQKLWLFLEVEANGSEGLLVSTTPQGIPMPLIAADLDRLHRITPLALDVSLRTRKKILLAEFSQRTDLETIGG